MRFEPSALVQTFGPPGKKALTGEATNKQQSTRSLWYLRAEVQGRMGPDCEAKWKRSPMEDTGVTRTWDGR